MSKFGGSSVWFLADGYNMIVNKLQGLTCKVEAPTEPTHGLGDSWEEHTPVGVSKAMLTQDGAFFFDDASYMHDILSTGIGGQGPSSSAKVVSLGFATNTTGQDFTGIAGKFDQSYEVLGSNGKLTRANAEYVVTGALEQGKIIRALAATTGDVTQYLDNAAATTNGGSAYFQVTAVSMGASTGIALTVAEATSSAGAYTTVATVTVSAIGAYRVESTDDTIERWLSATVDFSSTATSGSPSITAFIGFARL